jgi:hypothetical protein
MIRQRVMRENSGKTGIFCTNALRHRPDFGTIEQWN